MTLSAEDGQLYYKLWLRLLEYVNDKFHIVSNIQNMSDAKTLNPNDVKKIADKMWDNVSLIDMYLSECASDIQPEHRDIIRSWKRRIRGRFLLERHLKSGSIFISLDDEQVYLVSGIISSWKEMFSYAPMPLIIEAVFMPFKDVIISDGLVMPYNLYVGRNMASDFKDLYMSAKKNGEIHKSL